MSGQVFHMDFKIGKLVPLSADLLPVGSLVSYEDMANPRERAAITGADVGAYGYGQACIFEDGHKSQVHADTIDKFGRTGGAWHFVRGADELPVILDAAALAEFVAAAEAAGIRRAAEAATAATAKAAADEAERARIIAAYPYLEQVSASKKSGHALAAANLRKLLARELPGVKFSVVSDSFSMGNSVDCHWIDGPTSAQVDKFADLFQECDFDGMDDSTSYRHSVWCEVFGGAKYCNASRSESDGALIAVAAELGHAITFTDHHAMQGVDYETEQMIHRETRARSFYIAPTAPAPAAIPAAPADSTRPTVTENEEKDGVEIRFPAKPAAIVLDSLKGAGWRWSRFSSCWYHRRDAAALALAHNLANSATTS